MEFTFSQFDPAKKRAPRHTWSEDIPKSKQYQMFNINFRKTKAISSIFRRHNSFQREPEHRKYNGKNDKSKLEKKYGERIVCCTVYDMDGNSIWFNKSYMKALKRSDKEYFCVNYIDTFTHLNGDHPFTEIFLDKLEGKPKQMKMDASTIVTSKNVKISMRLHFDRIDDKKGIPFGYIAQFVPTVEN
eukprot:gene8053-12515_t